MRRLTILISTICLLFCVKVAKATESALTASPAIIETVLKIGEPTKSQVLIQNNTNFPLPIQASSSRFLANEEIPTNKQETFDASSWFTIEPKEFILQPNELKTIDLTITPPKRSEPGGHYATIFFQPLIPEQVVTNSQALSLARVGVLALMIVPGNTTEGITLNSFAAPEYLSFGPIKYQFEIKNNGNLHLIPKVELSIQNLSGKTVFTKNLPPELILPDTTKKLEIIWPKKLPFGRFSAKLTISYGTNNRVITSDTLNTYVLPWPIILLLILLLTLFYKIFIVNGRRIVDAYHVLRGNYDQIETNSQKNNQPKPKRGRPRSTPNPTHNQPRLRRQSNR